MNYKAPDNSLHFIEPEYAHLLPSGSVPITEEEVGQIRIAAIVPPTVADQLAALDAANALTQRNLRDFILLTTEALKLGQPVDLSQVRGIQAVMAVEAEAAALRVLLNPPVVVAVVEPVVPV